MYLCLLIFNQEKQYMSNSSGGVFKQFITTLKESKSHISLICILVFGFTIFILVQNILNPSYKASTHLASKAIEMSTLKKVIGNINNDLEGKSLFESSSNSNISYMKDVNLKNIEIKPVDIKNEKETIGIECNLKFEGETPEKAAVIETKDKVLNEIATRLKNNFLIQQKSNFVNSELEKLNTVIAKALKRDTTVTNSLQGNNVQFIYNGETYNELSTLYNLQNKLLSDQHFFQSENLIFQISDLTLVNDNFRKSILLINAVFLSIVLSLLLVAFKMTFLQ